MASVVGKQVGGIGFGMMGLTMKPAAVQADEKSIAALKAALDAGANMWNGGEIYGTTERNSLHLLNAYFTQYPADADKVVLSIKGGYTGGGLANPGSHPDGSAANVRRSIDECLRVLDGKKFLDIFECARVDPKVPIEETLAAANEYVTAGKIGGISISEVGEKTIRRAVKVAKIVAVEVEFSLFSTDILTNGIASACAELDIPIVAYSPMGRGFLTGELKSPDDFAPHDFRKHFPRFQGEAFYENLKLVKAVEEVAKRKGVTPGQVSIAWITEKSGKAGLPTIIPIPGASSDSRVKENTVHVELTAQELTELDQILKQFVVAGNRYPAAHDAMTEA